MARRSAFFSRLAVFSAVSLCAIPAVAGGTITFVGAIVEPPYEIRVAPAPLDSSYSTSTAGAEISFNSIRSLSASVRADGLGPLPVALRCAGGTPLTASGCHLGPHGGTLSVAMKSTAAAGTTPAAILTVAYD
ncbi:hypothetical protein AB4Z46_32885 [Variovorax sp. M-6]|uniref:hypothetical protein n=1 Tax=Variovorax sp. M-6 TaxID=3233041 RepID=UPI003F9CE04A